MNRVIQIFLMTFLLSQGVLASTTGFEGGNFYFLNNLKFRADIQCHNPQLMGGLKRVSLNCDRHITDKDQPTLETRFIDSSGEGSKVVLYISNSLLKKPAKIKLKLVDGVSEKKISFLKRTIWGNRYFSYGTNKIRYEIFKDRELLDEGEFDLFLGLDGVYRCPFAKKVRTIHGCSFKQKICNSVKVDHDLCELITPSSR